MKVSRLQFKDHSAFTLIEVVIMVLVLAIAVPPTLGLLDSASSGRVDAINTTRATFLATTVMETILADVSSSQPTLGFAAFENPNQYLNDEDTGLYARLEEATDIYKSYGLDYKVSVGPLVSSDGTVSAEINDNIFRLVTVNVSIESASTSAVIMPVSMFFSEM